MNVRHSSTTVREQQPAESVTKNVNSIYVDTQQVDYTTSAMIPQELLKLVLEFRNESSLTKVQQRRHTKQEVHRMISAMNQLVKLQTLESTELAYSLFDILQEEQQKDRGQKIAHTFNLPWTIMIEGYSKI
mmetsp:Transcript_64712/g.75947  ORF Transcript_64712/g.75947 Transcript_64712/m.75947 type:complete len:131 (+) Transcript_64712:480-872(+)